MPPGSCISPSPKLSTNLCLDVEHQDLMRSAVGDKQSVVIVHRQAEDRLKMRIDAVLDQLNVVGFSVEDEDRSDFGIGNVQQTLGIDSHAIRRQKLKARLRYACLYRCRPNPPARRSIQPAFFCSFFFVLGISGIWAEK